MPNNIYDAWFGAPAPRVSVGLDGPIHNFLETDRELDRFRQAANTVYLLSDMQRRDTAYRPGAPVVATVTLAPGAPGLTPAVSDMSASSLGVNADATAAGATASLAPLALLAVVALLLLKR